MPRTSKKLKLRLKRISGAWEIQDGENLYGPYEGKTGKVEAIEDKEGIEAFYTHCDEPGFISVDPISPKKKQELPDVVIDVKPLILGEEK